MEINVDEMLAGMPVPTPDEMARARARARRYTLVLLRRAPNPPADGTEPEGLHMAHMQHLGRLQAAGKLVLTGPILADDDLRGVSVYAAELAEARALAEADPKVRAGYLMVEALPWVAVPSESEGAGH
jgi:uncharacterized protein YciI